MKTIVYLACLLLATGTIALPPVVQYQMPQDGQDSVPMLSLTKAVAVGKLGVTVKNFMFKDCGGSMAMTTISSVSITPDPLSFPGPLNVATMFRIKSPLTRTLTGDVLIEKKVLGKFVKIPCVDNFGSCTYNNLCDLLEQVQCPDPIVKIGIDCRCPIPANSYNFPMTEFDVDLSIPLSSGDYHIVGNVTSNSNVAFCVDVMLTLS